VTVGTGVGVGLVVGREPLIGRHHPELGHVRYARLPGDVWPGSCPFHGDCIEGVASGTAIEARCAVPAATLPQQHPVWQPVAHALAQLAQLIVLSVAPQRIVFGGGVACGQAHLLPRIRHSLAESLNGYIRIDELENLERFIVRPGLGTDAGPLGALAVAAAALEAS
jgi:fructokinase